MEGIVGSLRLGWDALLLREDAYERMRAAVNPVVKGLVLILVVGLVIGLLAFVGDLLEWATTPDMGEMQATIYDYITQMPWWDMANQDPQFRETFDFMYEMGWSIARSAATPTVGSAALGIILTPLGLVVRWLIYGLLAYLFARWLGGTGELSTTLGVLALAVAPQILNVFTILPYVTLGSVVTVWGVLCAYLGIKIAHNLPWYRAMWATLLPFILVLGILIFGSCLGTAIFAAVVKGG